MEAVLDTCHPVVCVDELSKTLHAHVRSPQAPRAGRAARQDYGYKRHGHRNLCMMTAPCLGWRMVKVTRHRQRPEFAASLKELGDVHFPAAERITLVCDNLNIHQPSVLCDCYDPATAGRIRQKLQWVHTPKHASWAQRGRNREQHPDPAGPATAHPRYRHAGPGVRRLVPPPQPARGSRAMALHHCRCPDQTAQNVPTYVRKLQH